MTGFKPIHINATEKELTGNQGIGRYVLLPGSDGRAKVISEHFNEVSVKPHPRGHNLFLGTLNDAGKKIDVAAVATGMGCPSMEIILHELFHLGAKRFLRVGTAGSLQPKLIGIGDFVNVQASVRDEDTTTHYVPLGFPALASLDMVTAINAAATQLNKKVLTGIVHCKSSFYAREFGAGPQAAINNAYIDLLTKCGVLASEMETAALFIQSQLYHHQLQQLGSSRENSVLAGALLGILAIPPDKFASEKENATLSENLIALALESIKNLANTEL